MPGTSIFRARPLLVVLVAGALAVLLSAAASPSPSRWSYATAKNAAAAAPRPNIVMIMTDDQDVKSLSVMPNVRRLLAAQGTTYRNNFVSYPLCCPSRATYLTGQYPHNHGVVGNKEPDGGYYRLRKDETLPVWLTRAGYATAHIGKYLNGYGTRNPREIPPGWQEWHGAVDPTTYRMWGYKLNDNGTVKQYGVPNVRNPRLYQTDVYANKAVDYVNRKAPAAQPFFLSLAVLAPHTEGNYNGTETGNPRPAPRHKGTFANRRLPRPPSFNEADMSDKPRHLRRLKRFDADMIAKLTRNYRARLESLLSVDDAVARIVKTLAARGELDNTLIIFTSDNGWLHGEHRVPGGKVHPFEESSRVPLIVRGPGAARNKVSAAPVSNVDLAPTILAAAKAKPGIKVDGRPLLAAKHKRDLLIQTGPKRSAQWWYSAIRDWRYLYVEHSHGDRELYDLAKDPYQLRSVHADPAYAAVKKDLARRLQKIRDCAGKACP